MDGQHGTIYRDDDVSLESLEDKLVAIIGYGIQGRPQALCMRDSGLNVIVGAAPAEEHRGWDLAEEDGFEVFPVSEAVEKAEIVHILLPDPAQPGVYQDSIRPHLMEGDTLSFAHGFNIIYGAILPPKNVDVVLYVPNGPGHTVREKYLEDSGIYGAVAVEQDYTGKAMEKVLGLAKACGSTRVGVVEVSFQQETEGDNFEEQVLYGGTIELMKRVFNTMVEGGYPPHFAYAKAIRSLRTIVDVIDEEGIEEYVSRRASRTAEFAIRWSGPRVVNADAVDEIFEETEQGQFAKAWMQEWELGMPTLHRLRRTEEMSLMEKVGREWRKLFGHGRDTEQQG